MFYLKFIVFVTVTKCNMESPINSRLSSWHFPFPLQRLKFRSQGIEHLSHGGAHAAACGKGGLHLACRWRPAWQHFQQFAARQRISRQHARQHGTAYASQCRAEQRGHIVHHQARACTPKAGGIQSGVNTSTLAGGRLASTRSLLW